MVGGRQKAPARALRCGLKSLFLPPPQPTFISEIKVGFALGPHDAGSAVSREAGGSQSVGAEDNRMGSLSIWHWIIVIAVVLLLFGRGKISELMGDVAQGIKAFKKGMSEEEDTAKVEPAKGDPKTIDHQAASANQASAQPQTESRKAG